MFSDFVQITNKDEIRIEFQQKVKALLDSARDKLTDSPTELMYNCKGILVVIEGVKNDFNVYVNGAFVLSSLRPNDILSYETELLRVVLY